MRLEDIQEIIEKNIPELLNIGDYRGRVEKIIKILKNTRTKYDQYYITQESDDVVEILESFLLEDEAYGFMKEQNQSAFSEANKILDICKCCLYESKHHQEIPIKLVSHIRDGFKVSILGICIGDLLSDAMKNIKRYGVIYDDNKEYNYIKVENDFILNDNSVTFKLYIYHDGSRVSKFCLTNSYCHVRWKVLSLIDEIFAGCRYVLKDLSEKSISQIYSTYYNIADVYHSPNETYIKIISAKQYEKENKPWWKF